MQKIIFLKFLLPELFWTSTKIEIIIIIIIINKPVLT